MDENSTMSLELTDDELQWILMYLTLSRNIPRPNEMTEIDELIEKVTAHTTETAVAADEGPFEGIRDEHK